MRPSGCKTLSAFPISRWARASIRFRPAAALTTSASASRCRCHDRNQGERAKALIEKQKAQNEQQLITNQVLSDVDKALVAFEIQKRRVELYRTGVLDQGRRHSEPD